jgi:hypothetical protein
MKATNGPICELIRGLRYHVTRVGCLVFGGSYYGVFKYALIIFSILVFLFVRSYKVMMLFIDLASQCELESLCQCVLEVWSKKRS